MASDEKLTEAEIEECARAGVAGVGGQWKHVGHHRETWIEDARLVLRGEVRYSTPFTAAVRARAAEIRDASPPPPLTEAHPPHASVDALEAEVLNTAQTEHVIKCDRDKLRGLLGELVRRRGGAR
jgi:hypothetical protein